MTEPNDLDAMLLDLTERHGVEVRVGWWRTSDDRIVWSAGWDMPWRQRFGDGWRTRHEREWAEGPTLYAAIAALWRKTPWKDPDAARATLEAAK